MLDFAPKKELVIDVERVGASAEPVLIIDDFLAAPRALVAAATRSPDWRDLPPGGYPGRRAPLPGDYVRQTLRRLDQPIRQKLLAPHLTLDRFDCSFSLVTRAPEELTPLQRVPHIDVAHDTRVAVLHYLCDADFGGTAFFRQISTGFERVGPADKARYLAERKKDIAQLTQSNAFPDEKTVGYQQIGKVAARFNRLVVYRSMLLHSGIISAPERLSSDPQLGRLTANFFVDYAAPKDG